MCSGLVTGLSLHLGKTEAILFGSKRKLKNKQLDIVCNDTQIASKSSVTYLGAEIDSCLNGELMASKILKKCNARLKFLYRKSKLLTKSSKRLLASSLIQCHLDYACSFWYSGLTLQTKTRLQSTQNRLIRLVLNLPSKEHLSTRHFSDVGWLPVGSRVDQIKILHVHRIVNKLAPCYLSENFTLVSEIHDHCTRSSLNCFYLPKVGSNSIKSFFYTSIKLWNSIPNLIKKIESRECFKSHLKKHIMSNLCQIENQGYKFY